MLTSANSGSFEGSNRPSLEGGATPSSPAIIADDTRASAKIGPFDTVTK